jgi:hypothetical protein
MSVARWPPWWGAAGALDLALDLQSTLAVLFGAIQQSKMALAQVLCAQVAIKNIANQPARECPNPRK